MFHSEEEIDRIGTGILDHSLPKPDWTHAAHWAAAVWLLRHPDYDAEADMPDIIRAYNMAYGVKNTDTEGYHETITLASLYIARRFLAASGPDAPMHEVVNALLNTGYSRSDWIFRYWSKEKLFTAQARRNWIGPDREALPG